MQPKCAHFPACGGCSFQDVDYSVQLQEKQKKIETLFAPLLSKDTKILPIVPCEDPWHYRNKMEFSFSQNKKGDKFLGLILGGSRGYVFNLQECHLVSPWFAEVVRAVFAWWEGGPLCAFRRNGHGTLRYLTLREGIHTQDKMVVLTVSGNPEFPITKAELNTFVDAVCSIIGRENVSIFLRVQQSIAGQPTRFYEMHLFGKDHIQEVLHVGKRTLRFKISLSSFFQPNSKQAAKLYEKALSLTPHPKKRVLDLYAGTATLGIVFAEQAEEVISIELAKEAILDAQENCQINGVSNVTLYAGDTGEKLKLLMQQPSWERPNLAIVDPPRAGLGAAVVDLLVQIGSQEILYISCNPTTQVVDLQALTKAGYQISRVQPVDQFPHTPHLENIVLLKKLDLEGFLG